MNLPENDPGFLAADLPELTSDELLRRIDTYCDIAPRATARIEDHGSLVLFVAEQGWPFYARPGLVRHGEPTTDQIRTVLARQTDLGVPRALEWVHETTPSLAEAARAAGMTVHECPLLVLGSLVEPRPADGEVRLMDADDPDQGSVSAAIDVAFAAPGTALGPAGASERDKAHSTPEAARRLGFTVEVIRAGQSVRAGAFAGGAGAVGGGSHNPRGGVSEIVGVGVLPAFRRRGLAGAVAYLLARQAVDNGVTTVFCGAESNDVARVYEQVGFRRIGTTCVAGIDAATNRLNDTVI